MYRRHNQPKCCTKKKTKMFTNKTNSQRKWNERVSKQMRFGTWQLFSHIVPVRMVVALVWLNRDLVCVCGPECISTSRQTENCLFYISTIGSYLFERKQIGDTNSTASEAKKINWLGNGNCFIFVSHSIFLHSKHCRTLCLLFIPHFFAFVYRSWNCVM